MLIGVLETNRGSAREIANIFPPKTSPIMELNF
jgi:hypothetical protein